MVTCLPQSDPYHCRLTSCSPATLATSNFDGPPEWPAADCLEARITSPSRLDLRLRLSASLGTWDSMVVTMYCMGDCQPTFASEQLGLIPDATLIEFCSHAGAGPASSRHGDGHKAPSMYSVSEAGDLTPFGVSAPSEGTSEAGHAPRPSTLGKLSLGNASSCDTAVSSMMAFDASPAHGDLSRAAEADNADRQDALEELSSRQTYSVPEESPTEMSDEKHDTNDERAHGKIAHATPNAADMESMSSSSFHVHSKAMQHLQEASSNGDTGSPGVQEMGMRYAPPSHDQQQGSNASDMFAGMSFG